MDENLQINDVKKTFELKIGTKNNLFCKLMSVYGCLLLGILVFVLLRQVKC